MPSSKEEVIENIRMYTFGINLDTQGISEDITRYIIANRDFRKNATRLANEINTKKPQFIFELIQNAEDNDYNENVKPTIKFIINSDRLIIQNNEKGFEEKNVKALCGIGATTKKNRTLGYIGEKGIGFKSVFMISDNPHIYSNHFRFEFIHKQEEPESFIIPHWVNTVHHQNVDPSQTNIVLPFKPEARSEISQYIEKIHPSLLLFLTKLKIIEIKINQDTPEKIKRDDHNGLIKIVHGEKKSYWRAIKKTFDEIPERKKGEMQGDIHETEIILAFPLSSNCSADASKEQPVFAFLPVKGYGFKFIIQADFLLPVSREDIIKDNDWNKWLRDQIVTVFLDAITEFKVDEKLRSTFYNYLSFDNVKDEFFLPVVKQIYKELKNTECILTETNQWKKPSDVLDGSEEIRKLVSNEDLMTLLDKEYLSTKIKAKEPIRSLGIYKFAIDNLIKCLENTEWVKKQSDDWFVLLYEYLSKQKLSDEHLEQLKGLDIIRLENEKLTSIKADDIFLPLTEEGKGYGFENELRILKGDIVGIISKREEQEEGLKIKEFLKKLGIRPSDSYEIIEKHILPIYQNDEWKQKDPPATLLGYVKYIKDNIDEYKEKAYTLLHLKSYLRIRVDKTAEGTIGYELPKDIYLSTIYGNENDLETLFEGIDVNFVHPCYIEDVLKECEEKIESLKGKLKGRSRKWRKKHKKEVKKIEEQIESAELQRDDKIKAWREFFIKLSVNKSLIVKKDPKTVTNHDTFHADSEVTEKWILKGEKGETVWNDCDWKDTEWVYYIRDDWISNDFDRITDDSAKRYLFSWNSVPGKDNERLLKYLRDDLNINWVENAKIYKSEDSKTISIRKNMPLSQFDEKVEIMIDEEMEKATLKIGDDRTHDLKVIPENDKLNLYGKHNEEAKSDICKQLVNIIDTNWADFKEYKSCKYYYREYNQRGWSSAETPSTFSLTLKKESWLPTTQNTIVTPSQIFLDKPEIREVLGDTVPYLAVEIKNEDFIKTIGINTEASVKNVLNYLKTLVEQKCDDKSKLNGLYEFLNVHFDEDGQGIRQTLSNEALIYIPDRNKFFRIRAVFWNDESDIFREPRGYLVRHYPDLKDFFVDKLGVSEKPLPKDYANVLVDLSREGKITSEDKPLILKIYEELNRNLNRGNVERLISEDDWWNEFIKESVFFTENNGFMRNDGDIFINDNPEYYDLFKLNGGIAFLWLPEGYHPDRIKFLIEATKLQYLSRVVELNFDETSGSMHKELTEKIREFMPYILWYLYWKENSEYEKLKENHVLEKAMSLTAYTVDKLEVTYTINNSGSINHTAERKCLHSDDKLYISDGAEGDVNCLGTEISRMFGGLKGLDDFIILIFEKETEDKIEKFMKFKNIRPLPDSEPQILEGKVIMKVIPEPDPLDGATTKPVSVVDVGVKIETYKPEIITGTGGGGISPPPNGDRPAPPLVGSGKGPDTLQNKEPTEIGYWGEEYALKCLRDKKMKKYPAAKIIDNDNGFKILEGENTLVDVIWCNKNGESSNAYDIKLTENGERYYIEVKSTESLDRDWFDVSKAQWKLMQETGDKFSIFRVYDARTKNPHLVEIANPAKLWRDGKIIADPIRIHIYKQPTSTR